MRVAASDCTKDQPNGFGQGMTGAWMDQDTTRHIQLWIFNLLGIDDSYRETSTPLEGSTARKGDLLYFQKKFFNYPPHLLAKKVNICFPYK